MILQIQPSESIYPTGLRERMGDKAPCCLHALGQPEILRCRLLGLLCSIQCPGSIVIKTLDAIRALRDAGVVVVGGFHSPMEKECLDILLRGSQPVVLCPARRIEGLRIGPISRQAVKEGRLLVLSCFSEKFRRTTATHAVQRNNLVAALADAVWVPHAAPRGKTWTTIRAAFERHQPVFTFEDDANKPLLEMGARPLSEYPPLRLPKG
jgi:predicted Rossmann fold nucleotide-binding protein DprA/Smf involved in DNA uptake